MLEVQRKRFTFRIREIWFADYPFEVSGSDSVLFLACKNGVQMKGFSCEEQTTLAIDLTQDLGVIWRNLRRDTRRGIGRAKRQGIRITVNRSYEEFYELNLSFRQRKGLPLGSWGDIDFMKKHGALFLAEFEGRILGGMLFLEDENHVRWLIGASRRLGVRKEVARVIADANRLTLWEAIAYAKNKGKREFDLGGFYVGEVRDEEKERIGQFKLGFGGKYTLKYNYRKDYSMWYRVARRLYELT